ncbi:MAG TPA: HAD-IIIA family hydrolase [Humidesulfovibrio sp.]|uniref:HAD-IIIA family hydrolase n=1 Tax=Humidesulfovibrio sp. TaxID=2910988 RepID=UPI002C991992|nr:HAD-IIIA family hydrolase [Humidesulfovibrio sp.]HWR04001.1 HAD-IIIA family hydrolase [Humidesulfovibrio sp.]
MPGFDSVTAYILAGGFGTRLRQAVPDRPKALAEILGRPYIYHLLDALADFGLARVVLCTGHMAQMLEDSLGPSYRGMELLYSREDEPLGTGGALKLALSRHPAELALCINGDSLTDANLAEYLRWFEMRQEPGALLLVPVKDAARYGSVSTDISGRVTGFVEKGQGGPGWISAGVYLLHPSCLEAVAPGQSASIEQDVFPALAEASALCAYRAQARFLDIGTPESYASAGRFLLGDEAAGDKLSPAVFLDRDGTVIVEKHYLHDPDGVELLPGAAEGMRRMVALGLRLVLVSNQSGVGRGYFGRDAVERVHGRLIELLAAQGVRLDALYICPHAPGKDGAGEPCGCRKPLPGLIERASRELGLDPARSFVIGDKPCDVDMGLVVNATTFLVTTGYGAAHAAAGDCRPHHVAAGLSEAAGIIESILAARASSGVEHA